MKMLRATVLALGSCALAATMFAPAYMKLGDIKGEATDADHKDWIIIESISADAAIASSREAGSGMATGKRQHKPFVITKPVDKASPKLAEACAKGTVLPEVEVGGPGVSYKLKDVVITSIQPSSSGGDRPMESLSLNFTKIEMTYEKDKKAAVRESPTRATTKDAKAKTERAP